MLQRFPVRPLILVAGWFLLTAQHSPSQHGAGYTDGIAAYAVPEDGGVAQSPINILTGEVTSAHHEIVPHYRDSAEHLLNTGHSIEADFDAGSTLEYDGLTYELKQLHFHTPSEHQVDGLTYPLELHMVHTLQSDPGKFLVIGLLFKDGGQNAFIEEVLAHAPREAGSQYDAALRLDPMDVLEKVGGYYHYEGSLTTPPYTETVTWLVMKDVHEADSEQIQQLNILEGNNARHIQNLHARSVDGE